MDVSVVIPTFDRAHTLARALDSVLAQTLPPREIIVVDDGSGDATAGLVTGRYPQVVYLHQENAGVSRARNRGIEAARGAWIALLDSDDAWLPDKLARQCAALSENPGYFCCHSDEIWYRNGRRVNPMRKHAKRGGWILEHCLPRCAISPSTALLHRRLLRSVGGFDERLPACEDYDLWLRVCARYPVLLVAAPLTVRYAGHPDQLSRRHWGMDRFRVRALERLLDEVTLGQERECAVLRTLVHKLDVLLRGALKRGNHLLIAQHARRRGRHAERLAALEAALAAA